MLPAWPDLGRVQTPLTLARRRLRHPGVQSQPSWAGGRAERPWQLAQLLPLCVPHSGGYKSSQATPSKTLAKQDSLLPPSSLHILLTPPAHEVGAAGLPGGLPASTEPWGVGAQLSGISWPVGGGLGEKGRL